MKLKLHMKKWRWVLLVVVIVALAVFAGIWFSKDEEQGNGTFTVVRRDVVRDVRLTASVEPADAIALSFESGGVVSSVPVDVGNRVGVGTIIAVLRNADLRANRDAAAADVQIAEAELSELKRGARSEEVRISESKVTRANAAVSDATSILSGRLDDAFTYTDDAVHGKTDRFFTNPRTANPQFSLLVSSGEEQRIEFLRVLVENEFTAWTNERVDLLSDRFVIAEKARAHMNAVAEYLRELSVLASNAGTSTDKTDVFTARQNVATALTNLLAAMEKLQAARADLVVAENELMLERAPATAEELAVKEGEVLRARAKLASAEAALSKTVITAPIAGTITSRDADPGESVAAHTSAFTLLGFAPLEIVANVPEADIPFLAVGQHATVTLDAYGDEVSFEAVVVAIDPAETVIEGVPTYKTTLQFTRPDERIRSGMTADITIVSEKKEGVLALPARAVGEENGTHVVYIERGEAIETIPVTIGLFGSDGFVEIAGVPEGSVVRLTTKP